ncbi:MAG: hypothetical protein IJI41_13175 [Anaerolineaceae bacterium]|nr:hypothetical protein [Anaerolineaceae bacterium]
MRRVPDEIQHSFEREMKGIKKMQEMLAYYSDKGCEVRTLEEYRNDV